MGLWLSGESSRQAGSIGHLVKKWCVILGGVLLVKIWFLDPYISRRDSLSQEYRRKTSIVLQMEQMLANAAEYAAAHESGQAIDRANHALFFSYSDQAIEALSSLQASVRKTMVDAGLEVTSISFGEPYSYEENVYLRLPLSFTGSAGAAALHSFLVNLSGHEPLVQVETLSISAQREGLRFRGQIVGFTQKNI